jgi:hypothetical protein
MQPSIPPMASKGQNQEKKNTQDVKKNTKETSESRLASKAAAADKEKARVAAAVGGTHFKEDNDAKRARVKRDGSISPSPPNEDLPMNAPEEYELTPGANGAASSDSPPEPVVGAPQPVDILAGMKAMMQEQLQLLTQQQHGFMNTITASISRLEVTQVAQTRDIDSLGRRLDAYGEVQADQMRDVRNQLNDHMDEVRTAVDNRFAAIQKECVGLAAAAPAARAPSAAASSAGPGRVAGPAGPARPGPSRSDENCLVIVRDFPEELPRSVLRETYTELLLFVPADDRREVHARINPVDKQIILVFPSSAKADSFLETFRAKEFVYIDQDTEIDYKLSAKKGRPLAIRRRGGATHPVFAAAADIVKAKAAFRNASLVPNPRMKAGVMHTEIHAQIGRKATPLFSIVFREDPHETVVSAILFATDNIFSEDECAAIRASASLQ